MLVEKYRKSKGDGSDKEIRAEIVRAIDASPSLRNKRDLIEQFVESLTASSEVDTEWAAFIASRKAIELNQIIEEENLNPDETQHFMDMAFRDGYVQGAGTSITKVLPPTSRFTESDDLAVKKQSVIEKLTAYLERFLGLAQV